MSPLTEFPAGSEWRKWDLHVHSPLSMLSNQFPRKDNGDPDWERYIACLESTDIAVVGITDYFSIDGYKKVRQFKLNGRLKTISTVLPNIEFRLNNVLSSRRDGDKPRRLNFHVIFSDEIDPQDIEEYFLHDLDFFYEGSPQSQDETRKLKVSNIEALGRKLIEENQLFRERGDSPIVIGATTTVVNHEQITDILTRDSRFRDKYLLVFPEEMSNLIEWGRQDHVIRQGLLQKSDMVFSSNSKTRKWCLALPPYEQGHASYIKEFKSLKPCIHGSDAHNLDSLGKPCSKRGFPEHDCVTKPDDCDHRYCWIKADPTFEGLKQIKYEPEDRVRIQASDPAPLKSNYCISAFEMEEGTVNAELKLRPINLELSTALVAVTGGKGAGKTALVDLIANFFVDRRNTSDPNSFVKRIVDDNADFKTTIRFKDHTSFTKSLAGSQFVEQSQIVYIAQGELERYIGEHSDLDKYIHDVIFKSPHVENTVKVFEFEKRTKKIEEIEQRISQSNRLIETLENRTAEKVVANAKRDKAQIEADLRDINSKIPALETRLTKEKVDVIQNKQTTRSALQFRKSRLRELEELMAISKQFVSEELARFNLTIAQINGILRELGIERTMPNLEYAAGDAIRTIEANVQNQLGQAVALLEASEKEIQGYESEMQEHAKHSSRKNELSEKLGAIDQKIQVMASDTQRLDGQREERNRLFGELLRTLLEQQTRYAEIIRLFGSQKATVLSDLDFTPSLQFNSGSLLAGLEDVLDNRQVEVAGYEGVESEFSEILKLYANVASGDPDAVDALVRETSRTCEDMKGKIKKSQAISTGALYRCLYGTYLNIVPVVTYKKTALNRLSLGQKATVLLKIYLAEGAYPIVIDSHDDHLDNEFIMEELVGAIREAKTFRQVILASNNGNVVINSDAEQIIIAIREAGEISYYAGSMENPKIRERALRVLEGGESAFKKRQEKYRIRG